jgi:hypothetical protein
MHRVGPEIDIYLETIFQKAEVFVARPIKGLNAGGDLKGFCHQAWF